MRIIIKGQHSILLRQFLQSETWITSQFYHHMQVVNNSKLTLRSDIGFWLLVTLQKTMTQTLITFDCYPFYLIKNHR